MGNSKIVSPTLRKLHDDLQGGREEALELFWKEIEKNGAPLIEKLRVMMRTIWLHYYGKQQSL